MILSYSDLTITIAYFSIPIQIVCALLQYPRLTRRMVLTKIVILLVLFALFIFLCGAGHLLRCLGHADTTVFHIINIATAGVSVITALYLLPMIPSLLRDLDESLVALARSSRIVESMFPANVRERMFQNDEEQEEIISSSTRTASHHHYESSASSSHHHNHNYHKTPTLKNSSRPNRQSFLSLTDMASNHSEGDNNDVLDATTEHSTCSDIENQQQPSPQKSSSGPSLYRRRQSITGPEVSENVHQLKTFLRKKRITRPDFNVSKNILSGSGAVRPKPISAPIADLFPSATIMFADIVGFTEWSSRNSPNQVFTLLETIFWEFDQLATAYGVFKLGTIGDSYIAVTGLPDPSDDHALVLAQFAEDCRRTMNDIVSDPLLGQQMQGNLSKLSMRFGLHSGSVTAGVLRGHKSRFELFGDTINTASRMETTGMPNRIQVSCETATLLSRDGKDSWLLPRDGLVQVKGKGQLQTYWLQVPFSDDDDDDDDDHNYCESEFINVGNDECCSNEHDNLQVTGQSIISSGSFNNSFTNRHKNNNSNSKINSNNSNSNTNTNEIQRLELDIEQFSDEEIGLS